ATAFFVYAIPFVPAGLEKIDSNSLTIGLLAAAIVSLLAIIFQLLYYRRVFNKRKELERLAEEEAKVAQVRRIAGE
ncbi:MAG TPA: hypothetical protein VH393_08890, partial [Ktedonobacterales bacterium]